MRSRIMMMFGAVITVLMASANDRWYQKNVLYNKTQDALSNMAYWTKDGVDGSGAPTATDDLVSAGDSTHDYFRIRMYGVSFTGNSWQVGEGDKYAEVVHDYAALTFQNSSTGLVLNNGMWWFNRANYTFQINGPVTVNSGASKPFTFTMVDHTNSTVDITGPVAGGEDTVMVFGPCPWWRDCQKKATFKLANLNGYQGTVVVTSSYENVGDDYGARLQLGTMNSSCHIEVCRGASLMTKTGSDVAKVGSINFRKGSRLWLSGTDGAAAVGCVCASGLVAIEDGPIPVKADFALFSENGYRVAILAGSSNSTFTASDFTLDGTSNSGLDVASFGSPRLEVVVDGATCLRTLYLVSPGIVWQTAYYENENRNADNGPLPGTSLTNAAFWSDGVAPYYAQSWRAYYTSQYLRTFNDPTADYVFPNAEFPCESLWLRGGHLRLTVASFTVPKLHVTGASSIATTRDAGSRVVVNAEEFALLGLNLKLQAYLGQTLVLNGAVTGTAPIEMRGWSGTGAPQAYYELTGINTNFVGNILVSQDESRPEYLTFAGKYPRLLVSDGRNLGGRLETFEPRALTLHNLAQLVVTNAETVTLADDLNRGVYVKERGRFLTDAGRTLDVGWPILFSGKLWKEGEGTLVLGGEAKHEVDDGGELTDVPRAGSNLFEVVSGTVKIRNANALAGVETTVAERAVVQIVLDPDNADLVKYGIRNVTAATPFSVMGGGKLNFSVDCSGVPTPVAGGVVTNALLTVSDAAVWDLRTIMPIRLQIWDELCSKVTPVSNGDGTTTFIVESGHFGFVLHIR